MPIKKKEKGEPHKFGVINIENYCGHIFMSKFDKLKNALLVKTNKNNGGIQFLCIMRQ